jgi:hypothetical protein
MHYLQLTRHYLTVSSPGGRRTVSCRTDYHKATALHYISRAKQIIEANGPPERISADPAFYQCGWCPFKEICHGRQLPRVNCRTCTYATPKTDRDGAVWFCERHYDAIPLEYQQTGCDDHLYLPPLLANVAEPIDADEEQNTITYRVIGSDIEFKNGSRDDDRPSGSGIFDSHEIRAGAAAGTGGFALMTDQEIQDMRDKFGARLVDEGSALLAAEPEETEPTREEIKQAVAEERRAEIAEAKAEKRQRKAKDKAA